MATGTIPAPVSPEPDPGATAADVIETHSGVVFFVGQCAYKLKKPVSFGFLDFTRREEREAACHREVALPRRIPRCRRRPRTRRLTV
jgi:aminoglycoside phosphotransferase family enzyme